MKIAFFDAKDYDIESFDKANKENYEITYFRENLTLETVNLAKGFDAICAFVNTNGDSEILSALAALEIKIWLQRSMGYNTVDLKKAKELGIKVFRVVNYSAESVAEHAVALLMALNRKLVAASIKTKRCNFSLERLQGKVINGSIVGVIGAGKIGQCFIRIMKGMGATILVHDDFAKKNFPETGKKLGFEFVTLNELATKSDFISLHAPLLPSTKFIINKELIKVMKKGIIIINTARGPLINTSDLVWGLKEKIIGGAGLDVLEREAGRFFFNCEEDEQEIKGSDPEWNELLNNINVIVTAHQAFFTTVALEQIATTTLDNAKLALENKTGPTELIWSTEKIING